MAYLIQRNGTAKDLTGQIICFSFSQFKDEVCKKGHCFVCGAAPSKSFNNEHIIPNWILKHCGIHNSTLTLPTGTRVKYSTYKIPCCQGCNSRLADVYETSISKVVCDGYDSMIAYIRQGGLNQIKAWLSLIFLKVHLRDFQNNVSLDIRHDAGMIGDMFELSELHHIHAVARAATVGVEIDDQVFGTLLVLKVEPSKMGAAFDYCDDLEGRTLLLQIQDVALIYVLDDCGATAGMLGERLKILPESISQIQLREVYVRHLVANLHIKKNPVFQTLLSGPNGKPRISVKLPEFDIYDYEPTEFGKRFASILGDFVENINVNGQTGHTTLETIAAGHVSFLFDENGGVINSR